MLVHIAEPYLEAYEIIAMAMYWALLKLFTVFSCHHFIVSACKIFKNIYNFNLVLMKRMKDLY